MFITYVKEREKECNMDIYLAQYVFLKSKEYPTTTAREKVSSISGDKWKKTLKISKKENENYKCLDHFIIWKLVVQH